MNHDVRSLHDAASKVPAVTLLFWIIKIAGDDARRNRGRCACRCRCTSATCGTGIFAAVFAAAVVCQIRARRFHPMLYWITIIATTTVGTTLADFADRSLGIGYAGGSALLLTLLLLSLLLWHRTLGSVSISTVSCPKAETFYWVTIMFSQTLGTALGDWTADTAGLGYTAERCVFGAPARVVAARVLLHDTVAHAAVLGGVRADPAARGGARRFPRQAAQRRADWRSAATASAVLLACSCRVHRAVPQRASQRSH